MGKLTQYTAINSFCCCLVTVLGLRYLFIFHFSIFFNLIFFIIIYFFILFKVTHSLPIVFLIIFYVDDDDDDMEEGGREGEVEKEGRWEA